MTTEQQELLAAIQDGSHQTYMDSIAPKESDWTNDNFISDWKSKISLEQSNLAALQTAITDEGIDLADGGCALLCGVAYAACMAKAYDWRDQLVCKMENTNCIYECSHGGTS